MKHSDDAKKRISVARKGKPLSEEHKQTIAEAIKGANRHIVSPRVSTRVEEMLRRFNDVMAPIEKSINEYLEAKK